MADEHWANAAMQLSPLPVLLDYTTLVHSHLTLENIWLSQNSISALDFRRRDPQKSGPQSNF